jgi:hypothetical protein
MWTPREQHALAVYDNFIYVSGGFASVLISERTVCGAYACGDTDASAYRYYLSDVWRSSDGETWTLVTENAFNRLGRGGHQMLYIPDVNNNPYLFVFGGRGGDNEGKG